MANPESAFRHPQSNDQCLARTTLEDARRFRDVLDRAEYSHPRIIERLGALEDLPSRLARNLPRLLRNTSRATQLDTLIRLFFIGEPVAAEAASQALAPVPLEKWVAAGLLEMRGGSVVAPVMLLPHNDLLLAFDQPKEIEAGARPDIVQGMTGSTLSLIHFTVRRRSRKTLDLGTGFGIQAFLAATHSDQVVAVDCNPRAINYAIFNGRLNGLSNIEFLAGDTFDPVRGQSFDLVLCNPPFMISSGRRYMYRDSGMGGDEYCRKIVIEVPRFLNEGGYCQMCCGWIHREGQDWKERLAGWFEGTGCDAWVLRTETQDPGIYASEWIRDTEQDSPEPCARVYQELMDYYEREKIEAISTGFIAMRRSSGRPNWLRFDDAPVQEPEPFGDAVVQGFALRDALEALREDEALLGQRLLASPELRLVQESRWTEGAWQVMGAQLYLVRGLHFRGNVDSRVAGLVARCNGQAPLRDVIGQMATALGVEVEKIAPDCLAVARQLIERGFLLPEGMRAFVLHSP